MKRFFLISSITLLASITVTAQKNFTKNGNISFFSKTSMENIDATSNQVMCVLDPATANLQFSVLVKSFSFKKALMQEHFNENYLESDKYPKSTFKGTIADINNVNFSKDGTYNISVTGDLNLHNVAKRITTPGTLTIRSGTISLTSAFNVLLSDYNIEIPKVVEGNISKTIEIKINVALDQKM